MVDADVLKLARLELASPASERISTTSNGFLSDRRLLRLSVCVSRCPFPSIKLRYVLFAALSFGFRARLSAGEVKIQLHPYQLSSHHYKLYTSRRKRGRETMSHALH